jgi:hypothetical protein
MGCVGEVGTSQKVHVPSVRLRSLLTIVLSGISKRIFDNIGKLSSIVTKSETESKPEAHSFCSAKLEPVPQIADGGPADFAVKEIERRSKQQAQSIQSLS